MEVQERILDTAFGLFRQYGTRSITMDDIANKMGISKKTLYAHFADKDDLVVNAISRELKMMQENCVTNRDKSADAIQELFLVMKTLEQLFRNMNPVVMLDLQKFHAKAYQVFQEYRNNYLHNTVQENLERGIKEGIYRADINVDIMTLFRVSSAMLCFQPEAFPVSGWDLSLVQRELLEHFLYGVASMKGYKLIEKYKQLSQTK